MYLWRTEVWKTGILSAWACRRQLLSDPQEPTRDVWTFQTSLPWKSKLSLLNKVKGQHKHGEERELQMPPDVRGKGWTSCRFSRNYGKGRICSRESHTPLFHSEELKTESAHPPAPGSNGILQSAAIPAMRRSLASVFTPINNWADVIFKVGFKGWNAQWRL